MGITNFIRKLFRQPPYELAVAHQKAQNLFTYISQPLEWRNTGRVLKPRMWGAPINGDCDDFAATVAAKLHGEYIEFKLPDGRWHAACLYKEWVSDNLRIAPYHVDEIKKISYQEKL